MSASNGGGGWFSREILGRLQNLFALTVWPQGASKELAPSSGYDSDDDVLLFGNRKPSAGAMFLDRYGEKDLRKLLVEFKVREGPRTGQSFMEVLASVGVATDALIFDIDVSDNFVHRLQAYCHVKDTSHLYVQLFIRRETTFSVLHTKTFDPAKSGVSRFFAAAFGEGLRYLHNFFAPTSSLEQQSVASREQLLQMIVIEWLRFQNPLRDWGATSPLPGQLHPGLGIVFEMHQLLDELCALRHRDGVLDIPEHWYNAYLYAKMPRPYRFLNPAFEGFFQSTRIALEPDIKQRGLPAVAWAVLRGQLRCNPVDSDAATTGDRIRWVGQEQVSCITPRLAAYFESQGYKTLVAQYTRPELFSIDWETPMALDPTIPAPPPSSPSAPSQL